MSNIEYNMILNSELLTNDWIENDGRWYLNKDFDWEHDDDSSEWEPDDEDLMNNLFIIAVLNNWLKNRGFKLKIKNGLISGAMINPQQHP